MMPSSPKSLRNKLWCKNHENPSDRISHTWAKNFAFLFFSSAGLEKGDMWAGKMLNSSRRLVDRDIVETEGAGVGKGGERERDVLPLS